MVSGISIVGWSKADQLWEDATLSFAMTGDRERSAEALALARTSFSLDDPRLGTALANHAAKLDADRRNGLFRGSARDCPEGLLAEAHVAWELVYNWLDGMRLPPQKSSAFHLRLEQKHGDRLRSLRRDPLVKVAEEARERVIHARLPLKIELDQRALERWQQSGMLMSGDPRRLAGACILLFEAHTV
ncbi:hypothetical protein [Fulvimarina pelagi]|uniref:hypothetical protein n=1 Tax=Fulvimarina pelagi TaxID=217511 RepID=UPI0011D10232|nr:hypothetical protein [Fulvimarina pelagi]